MHTGYVLHAEELGVYVGAFWGFGFWSLVDSVGQTHAVTFPTKQAAGEHLAQLAAGADLPPMSMVEVQTYEPGYADGRELVAAGLVEAAQPLLANERE